MDDPRLVGLFRHDTSARVDEAMHRATVGWVRQGGGQREESASVEAATAIVSASAFRLGNPLGASSLAGQKDAD